PDAGVSTAIKGEGGPDFGVRQASGSGTSIGSVAKPRSPFGWYAAQVQATISDALRKNSLTRNASFRLDVRVWADVAGRVTRATLVGTTGDPKVDAAIAREILPGLQLQSPPPADMPQPMVMRFTARRPN
ncbi:MAG: TonB C-terminal domain-containing protein, partial [Verrucomicrobiota bacterium]